MACSPFCDVQTLFWLPTGISCAQGVKANVLFFDRKPASERLVAWLCRLSPSRPAAR